MPEDAAEDLAVEGGEGGGTEAAVVVVVDDGGDGGEELLFVAPSADVPASAPSPSPAPAPSPSASVPALTSHLRRRASPLVEGGAGTEEEAQSEIGLLPSSP